MPSLEIGGAETYIYRFINYVEKRFDITVATSNPGNRSIEEKLKSLGINIFIFKNGLINPISVINKYIYFKKSNFESICNFNGNLAGVTVFLAKIAGIKNRITFYRRSSDAFNPTKQNKLFNKFLNKLVSRYSTKILANSNYAMKYFFKGKILNSKYKVIYNGVNKDQFSVYLDKNEAKFKLNLPSDIFLVGHIGRYDSSKNHKTIFAVAKRIKEINPNIRFLFCGKDTNTDSFHTQLRGHKINDICYALGIQNNIPLVFNSMDLFYFPSITEGQPNALIEAMLMELPIISSDIPPIKEIIPRKYWKMILIPPLNVDIAVNKICNIHSKNYQVINLRNHASQKFNHSTNFKLFESYIS